MDLRKLYSGAAASPMTTPETFSEGYFTPGYPGSDIPAAKPGAWFFHQLSEEMRAVIVAAGLTPDHEDLGQLLEAIQKRPAGFAAFTTPGAISWTPPANVYRVHYRVVGGGGGGGAVTQSSSGGSGGGGGAVAEGWLTVTPGVAVTGAVGAAGTAGTAGGNGGTGGTTTLGAISATGGVGGYGTTLVDRIEAPALGGTATGADINTPGWPGLPGFQAGANGYGGNGGNSPLGAGGIQQPTAGTDARGYGAGGAGGSSGSNGGAGAGGAIMLDW
jgi:hypothetical protein